MPSRIVSKICASPKNKLFSQFLDSRTQIFLFGIASCKSVGMDIAGAAKKTRKNSSLKNWHGYCSGNL
jgi:hypothetical protein